MSTHWTHLSSKKLLIVCAFIILWIEQPNLPFGLGDIWPSFEYHLALILIGLALLVAVNTPESSDDTTAPLQPDDTKDRHDIQEKWFKKLLRHQFKTLQKQTQKYSWALQNHTWLVLGLDAIGRKTILKQRATCLTGHQERLSWWQHQSDVFCLGAPRLNTHQTAQHNAPFWAQLCRALRIRRFGRAPFDELVLVFHIPALHTPHEIHQARDIDQINAALAPILKQHRHVPCRIIFTQADYIAGFNETFTQLDAQQRQDSWHIECRHGNQSGLLAYDHAFDLWVSHLNGALIQRLHQEPCLRRRTLIKDFPLQLQRLKAPIKELLEQLCLLHPETLHSIHFCSTQQAAKPFDYLTDDLGQVACHSPNLSHNTTPTPIFCRNIFDPHLTAAPKSTIIQPGYIKHRTTLITGCAILLCIAAYCHHQWLHTLNSEFQQHRTTWWLPSPHQKAAAWRTASILKQDLNTLNQHTGLTHWLFPQTIQLQHKIQKHYQHLIQTELMSTLNTALNRQLSAHQPLEKRVEALEVLNQFKHPHSTDQHSVQHWISTQIGGYITQPWQTQLIQDLQTVFLPTASVQAQASNTQIELTTLPVEQQVVLRALATQQGTLDPLHIARPYAPKTFKVLIQKTFKHYCQQLSSNQIDQCVLHTKQRYYHRYLTYWLQRIQQPAQWLIQPVQTTLSQQYSTYKQALEYVNEALFLLKAQPDLPTSIRNSVQQTYLTWQKLKQPSIQTPITALIHTAEHANQTPHTQKQAFDTLIHQLQSTTSIKISDPLVTQWQAYANTLAQDALGQAAKTHINTIWSHTIWPLYHDIISQYYPFQTHAQEDLSLKHFVSFFGPQGTLEQFTEHYIRPFARFDGEQWYWHPHTPKTLTTQNLDSLALSQWIQKMFFHHGDQPLISFNLIPIGLHSDVKKFDLTLGQKHFSMLNGHEPAIFATWPLQGNDDTVSIKFTNQANESVFFSAHGPWALFKLFNLAELQPNLDHPRQFALTLRLKNHQAHYQLIVDEPLNPFSLNVFSVFNLPQYILSP